MPSAPLTLPLPPTLLHIQVKGQYLAWRRWMQGDIDLNTGTNWYTFNK